MAPCTYFFVLSFLVLSCSVVGGVRVPQLGVFFLFFVLVFCCLFGVVFHLLGVFVLVESVLLLKGWLYISHILSLVFGCLGVLRFCCE